MNDYTFIFVSGRPNNGVSTIQYDIRLRQLKMEPLVQRRVEPLEIIKGLYDPPDLLSWCKFIVPSKLTRSFSPE